MKKTFALVLALCLLLCGCGEKPVATEPTTEPTVPTTEATQPETTEATEPETEPSTEATQPETEPTEPPAPVYTDPFTGEARDTACTDRPFAVALDNAKQALPHWSVSDAQMIWEVPHEYDSTRVVAMYTDLSELTRLGPLRSARTHHVSLAQSFDALFLHAGYSPYAKQALKDTGWETLNGVEGKGAYNFFHRDQDRLNDGVALEHTMYITGPEVIEYSDYLGYEIAAGEEVDYGYRFAADGTPAGGSDAQQIQIRFTSGGKKTTLTYQPEDGKYTMKQYGLTYRDGISGSTVEFENVLILKADVGLQSGSDYRISVDLVDSGKGWYACGGKLVPITWERDSSLSPIRYYLEDGTPLTMGVGTTYAAVIKNGSGEITAS